MKIKTSHKIVWSLDATELSEDIAIPTNPAESELWIDGHHSQHNGTSSIDATALLVSARIVDVSGTRYLRVERSALATGVAVEGTTFVAERADAGTKLQKGTLTLAAATGSADATLSSIALTNAFPLATLRGGAPLGDDGGARSVTLDLVDATTLRVTRLNTTGALVIEWTVVENTDLLVQKRSFDKSPPLDVENLTFLAVDPDHTRIVASSSSDESTWADESARDFQLETSTNVRSECGYVGTLTGQRDIAVVYLVEDESAEPWTVQHVEIEDTIAASGSISLSTVVTGESTISLTGLPMVVASPEYSSATRIQQRLAEVDFADASSMLWERNGTDVCTFRWNVIEYGQPVAAALTPGLAINP